MRFGKIVAASLIKIVFASWKPVPRATDASLADKIQDGFSPRPTGYKYDLAKALDPKYRVCGYLFGDETLPLTCGAERPCGFDDDSSWFGCCASYSTSAGVLIPAACSEALSCVPYSRMSACTGACASVSGLTRCTNSATAYCVTIVFSDTQLYTNYLCGTTSLPVAVLLGTPTGVGGVGSTGSSSIDLIVPGGSVFSSPSVSSVNSGRATGVGSITSLRSNSATGTASTTTAATPSSTVSSTGQAMMTGAPLLVVAGGVVLALL